MYNFPSFWGEPRSRFLFRLVGSASSFEEVIAWKLPSGCFLLAAALKTHC